VFVFGNQTIDNAKTIKILQEEKKPILQELSDRFKPQLPSQTYLN
jgi:hypothetical protein